MARQKRRTPATIFSATVRSALEHITDPTWLGRNSPLASPYFLGNRRVADIRFDDPTDRGRILQSAIFESAALMWRGGLPKTRSELADAVDEERATLGSKSSRYLFYLLELRYLRKYYPSNTFPNSAESIPGFVNVSPTRFFIHLDDAINELGRRLLEWFSPGLRLEHPNLTRELIGRKEIKSEAMRELRSNHSVAITGAGGVGKTTLGAAIIAEWPGDVFWHTFRPGLNDDIGSILFSLGHFTRESGAPTLWAQLVADEGRIGPIGAKIGMLHMDLEAIAQRQPLLCFDEIDLLQTTSGAPRRKQHSQILELVESLRGIVPLLLIGQRVYVDTNAHFAVEPLSLSETNELIATQGIVLDNIALHRVQNITGGNPRLLELYAALQRHGGDIASLPTISKQPATQPIFSRLWRRLDESEQEILSALAVFRSFAPQDAWQKHSAAITDLIQRNLIKTDLSGGISLLPGIRDIVYESLPSTHRDMYHRAAARIRAQFGDYTAAAYHFVQANDPASAVEVWSSHQEDEILTGQAQAADEVFKSIDPRSLKGIQRDELIVIQNRLALLAGELDRILEGMDKFSWDIDSEPTAEALGQWAYTYELRDQADRALSIYDEAIAMATRLTTDVIHWRFRRGLILEETDIHLAQQEADVAQYDLERLRGIIHYLAGQFEQAETHFQTMLQIAELANNKTLIARAHQQLAMNAGRRALIDQARFHAEIAMSHYGEIGDRLQLEGMRAELAGMYLNVRQFEEVIEPSEKALLFFERTKHELWISTISTNLAEAYMETSRLEKAKEMVFKALHTEMPNARPYALYTLGHIHDRQGNPDHAAVSFREGIEVARTNGDPFIEAYLQRALGELYLKAGQTVDGLEHLDNALTLFGKMSLGQEEEATKEQIARATHEKTVND